MRCLETSCTPLTFLPPPLPSLPGGSTRRDPADEADLQLPLDSDALRPAANGLAMEFDVGLHIRTKARVLENPGYKCRSSPEQCESERQQEREEIEAKFLSQRTWDCLHAVLTDIGSLTPRSDGSLTGGTAIKSGVSGEDNARGKNESAAVGSGRALSIFLATDHEGLRGEFVSRLSAYGAVYYNGGEVAHIGVAKGDAAGRLPTMAEFFLLSKCHVIIELDLYLSTFSNFAGYLGNGTIVTVPYAPGNLSTCRRREPVQKGVWPAEDPRKRRNKYFDMEDEP